jgi:hypothetical protein
MRIHPLFVAALTAVTLPSSSQAQQKRPIERADQLPMHSYTMRAAPSSLLRDETAVAPLCDLVRDRAASRRFRVAVNVLDDRLAVN